MISEIALNFVSNSNFSSKGGGDGVCWGRTGTNGNFYELRGESILELKLKELVFVIFSGCGLLEPPIPTAEMCFEYQKIKFQC